MQPPADAPALRLVVTRISDPGTDIRELTLVPADGGALPAYGAGAHLRVELPTGASNAYSLIDLDGSCAAPAAYVLAIRRDDAGAGGSKHMHGLAAGDQITAHGPRNDFALDGGDAPVILLAGGIGVTPLLSMATALAQGGRDWRMHYAARDAAAGAYAGWLTEKHGARIHLHRDDEAGAPLPVAQIVAAAAAGTQIYVCGPRPMIEAVRRATEAAGLPLDHLHMELFDTPAPQAGDAPFEVEIAATGQVFQIPPGRSIIEVLEEGGIDLVYDCQRGDCGICQTDVLDGIPDHRDVVLSDAERAAGKVMQICVSRAKSARLKLDL
ncbi:MAG: PDR/VanB family oxidoreductase [Paracoccus sp. (in: a-proteobacteria)]|nr:PDR/VanB family oxidoreductase [Paracoccus sp. (in: a-proteobacteria)]